MTYQVVFSLVGLGWLWLVLQRVPHGNRIWSGGERSIAPLRAAVPRRRLERAVSWPALLRGSSGALASTQQRPASVAVLRDVLRKELVVCLAQSWPQNSPFEPSGQKAWFDGWNEERRSKDLGKHHGRALLLLAPVLSVVQNHCLCFTWSCSHLPSAPEEHILLYTSIFPTFFRHLCGSVPILPLQKIEIFISPSIFEELRFLSPWITWLVLCYAAFAASLLYNHCCSQYSVIQPHSSL